MMIFGTTLVLSAGIEVLHFASRILFKHLNGIVLELLLAMVFVISVALELSLPTMVLSFIILLSFDKGKGVFYLVWTLLYVDQIVAEIWAL